MCLQEAHTSYTGEGGARDPGSRLFLDLCSRRGGESGLGQDLRASPTGGPSSGAVLVGRLLKAPFSAWESSGRLVGSHGPYLQRWGFSGLGWPRTSCDRCCLGASGNLRSSQAPASPRPAASSPPLFSGPFLTALSQRCGACDFPHPWRLPSFAPCGCSHPWGGSRASAGLAAALEAAPLVPSCPARLLVPPCTLRCLPRGRSSSEARGLQKAELQHIKVYRGKDSCVR